MLDKGRSGDGHCNAMNDTNDEAITAFLRKACRKKVRNYIPSLQH